MTDLAWLAHQLNTARDNLVAVSAELLRVDLPPPLREIQQLKVRYAKLVRAIERLERRVK